MHSNLTIYIILIFNVLDFSSCCRLQSSAETPLPVLLPPCSQVRVLRGFHTLTRVSSLTRPSLEQNRTQEEQFETEKQGALPWVFGFGFSGQSGEDHTDIIPTGPARVALSKLLTISWNSRLGGPIACSISRSLISFLFAG